MAQVLTIEAMNARIGTLEGWIATQDTQLDEARYQLRELKAEVDKYVKPDPPAIPPEPGWWEEGRRIFCNPPWSEVYSKSQEQFIQMERVILGHLFRHGDGLERAAAELRRRMNPYATVGDIPMALAGAKHSLVQYLSELRT